MLDPSDPQVIRAILDLQARAENEARQALQDLREASARLDPRVTPEPRDFLGLLARRVHRAYLARLVRRATRETADRLAQQAHRDLVDRLARKDR